MFKFVNPALYGAVVLFFFLPFLEIRCNGSTLVQASGYALALNLKMDMPSQGFMGQMADSPDLSALDSSKRKPDVLSLGVLILMFIGGVLWFVNRKTERWAAIIGGSISTILLALLQLVYSGKLEEKTGGDFGEIFQYVKFTIHFGIGYWLSLLACLGLVVVNVYLKIQERRNAALLPYTPENEPDLLDEA